MTLPLTMNTVLSFAPGLPVELGQIVLDTWIETGDWELALAAMRSSKAYDTYYPGNRRQDGTLRYDEGTYVALQDDFAQALLGLNVNPDMFTHQFQRLIEGDVSPSEWNNRIADLNEKVLLAGDQTRALFAQQFGIDPINFTNNVLIASVLDPDISQGLFERRITTAQIGAQASARDLNIAIPQINRVIEGGITTSAQAADLFGQAAQTVPMLRRLIRRHSDPGDAFNLNAFIDAAVYQDTDRLNQISRLLAQEQGEFSPEDQFEVEDGAVPGLGL